LEKGRIASTIGGTHLCSTYLR